MNCTRSVSRRDSFPIISVNAKPTIPRDLGRCIPLLPGSPRAVLALRHTPVFAVSALSFFGSFRRPLFRQRKTRSPTFCVSAQKANRLPLRVLRMNAIYTVRLLVMNEPLLFVGCIFIFVWLSATYVVFSGERFNGFVNGETGFTCKDFTVCLWMMFVTMCTVGYGDISPESLVARLAAGCAMPVIRLFVCRLVLRALAHTTALHIHPPGRGKENGFNIKKSQK